MSRCLSYLKNVMARKYVTTQKLLGETPLEATEKLRTKLGIPASTPLSYAGRLDPMATGTLLILIGAECTKQEKYHTLDKTYEVELLFGVHSDSGDVLGIVESDTPTTLTLESIVDVCRILEGNITLPYPHFSSKTVEGKPLHTWALENRLHEIDLPYKTSQIYTITPQKLCLISKADLLTLVREKIQSLPEVTDPRKQLGSDFRREDVLASWTRVENAPIETFQVFSFTCTASSGTYMRSLAEHIAQTLGTTGLALSIHRTKIGKYQKLYKGCGIWTKQYK